MVKCLIDDTEHDCVEHLHLYLRKLKIKQSDYYEKYYARKDLFSGELIKYKDYDQYFSTDFLNKNNIKKYLKQYPEEGKKWAIDWLRKRKESKELVYTPTQVELRSLNCPTMHYYESVGGYYNIAENLGYKNKFKNAELTYTPLPENATIICDTREQRPLKLDGRNVINQKIDAGDYALAEPLDKKIYIERKSLADWISTCSKDLGRFKREIERAKKNDAYIIVLVENNISDALSFNYLPQTRYCKTTPSYIFKNVRDLLHEFDNLQFLFVDGRKEAANAIIKIFELGELVKNVDLEYYYETGDLKL